jgi:hypothetical protein
MNITNIQGFIYVDKALIGAPGADFLVAKRLGVTNNVDIVIDASEHAGSADISIMGSDYRAISVNGTKYTSPDALVTALNAVLEAGRVFPAVVNMADLPTSATGLATGDLYNSSGTVKVKS